MRTPKTTVKEIKSVEDLMPDNNNANKGSERGKKAIENSLQSYGLGRSIVVDANGKVIGGNKTLETAVETGVAEGVRVVQTTGNELVIVQRIDLDLDTDKEAVELGIADNRAGQESLRWDKDVLVKLSKDRGVDLTKLFGGNQALRRVIGKRSELSVEIAEKHLDSAGEIPNRVKRGELWQCAGQRIFCGDATEKHSYAYALQGERATLSFTSPPYNAGSNELDNNVRNTGSKYRDGASKDAMTSEQYFALLNKFTELVLQFSEFAVINAQMLAGSKLALIEWQHRFRYNLADIAIWAKPTRQPAMASNVLNSDYEFLYILNCDASPINPASRAISCGNFRGNVDAVYRPSEGIQNAYSEYHAATFPLHLAGWVIGSFLPEPTGKDIAESNPELAETFGTAKTVLDPFCGTGTTLVACHLLGHNGVGIELDEFNCDIILHRLEKETGEKAEKIGMC